MVMSFEETVLSISGKPFPEAFRLYQSQRIPSFRCIYCPYSEMKHFVETVFKKWILKRIADADEAKRLADERKRQADNHADEARPVLKIDEGRFYQEVDACRVVFETWVEEACGIFNIAKPPPAAALPSAREDYVEAYYL